MLLQHLVESKEVAAGFMDLEGFKNLLAHVFEMSACLVKEKLF